MKDDRLLWERAEIGEFRLADSIRPRSLREASYREAAKTNVDLRKTGEINVKAQHETRLVLPLKHLSNQGRT
jgi:hypothetical protein